VGPDFRTLRTFVAVLTRVVALTVIASLLILVLLPAALAAQGSGG
jgi:hypothetical protein